MAELTSTCPVCGAVATSAAREVAHMNAEHPEVIAERLASIGVRSFDVLGYTVTGGRWGEAVGGLTPEAVAVAHTDPLGFVPVLTAVRRALCFFPGRGWKLAHPPGSWWLLLDLDPAWGEEATAANGPRSFSVWLNTGEVYRVDSCGAAEDDPIPLDTLDPTKDKL